MDSLGFDDDYVRRLRMRDARTEEHFFNYFRPRLFNYLRTRVRTAADVEEKCQETLTRVLQSIYDVKLRDGRTLPGFVFQVCANVVHEYVRGLSRTEPLTEHHPEPVVPDDDQITTLISAELREAVQHVLDELDPRDADILRAVFIHERSREEICREKQISNEYLRVLLHRALQRFRKKFPPDGETNGD
jgi:RNA polymerase sigma-70 factor (ECF subfamily)